MRLIPCVQGTQEWLEARCGIPSASNFKRIITPKTSRLSEMADDYICELLAEQRALHPLRPAYMNGDMQDGIDCEPRARAWYAMQRGVEVEQVGFVMDDNGRFGCSPDGLIKSVGPAYYAGTLELKCPTLKTHVKYLLAGGLPDEYKPQVHGQLIVTGLPWVDFVSYAEARDVPPLLVRVEPSEYTMQLRVALNLFWDRLEEAKKRIAALAA